MSSQAATIDTSFFDSMNEFTSSLEKSLGRSLDPLKDLSKQMSSSKFGKNAKSFGAAMKGMADSSVNAWKMEQVMKLIEPFMKLLKLLEPPIAILSALLTMMINEVFIELIPYMIDFAMEMMKWAPIFVFIGKALALLMDLQIRWGQFMKGVFLEGLTIVFLFLKEKFLPIWERLKSFFVAFGTFLGKIFQPFWDALKASFTILKKAWDDSGGKIFGKTGFIANAFRGLMDIVKLIANGVIGSINRLISEFNKIPGIAIDSIPLLAAGGLAFGPTLAMVGDNAGASTNPEVIAPLDKLQGMMGTQALLSEMEETNSLLRMQNKLLRERQQWLL